MQTIGTNRFATSDASLAAYLWVKEIRLHGVQLHNSRSLFVFDMPPEGMVDDFKTGRGQVSALLYYRAYKTMINKVKGPKVRSGLLYNDMG